MALKDKDWLTIVAHYRIFMRNSDVIKELFEQPAKQLIAFMLIVDWVLLRMHMDLDRTLVAGVGIVLLPAYILFKYRLGGAQITLDLQNTTRQRGRNKNDIQWETAFAQINEIHRRMRDEKDDNG